MNRLSAFYKLTKPGVLYGNVLTTVAGFLLASQGNIAWGLFAATVMGTSLVIGSACVINNYLDQDIDSIMERTKDRPLINGTIASGEALAFGLVLGLAGLSLLAALTNYLVVAVGLAGFITYIWLYGAWSKRRSVHGTLVGSLSGAAPILAGYLAVTGQIDAAAIVIFAVLFFWQMPEFYSISVFRKEEYAAAGVPVISVSRGVPHTIRQILLYTVMFVSTTLVLPLTGVVGWTYFVVMLILGAYFINLGILGLQANEPKTWARQMFRLALIALLVFCFLISVGWLLP